MLVHLPSMVDHRVVRSNWSFNSVQYVVWLQVLAKHLVESYEFATAHFPLELASHFERLIHDLLDLLFDVLFGFLAHIHDFKELGHLRRPVVIVFRISDRKLTKIVTKTTLALLNSLLCQNIQVENLLTRSAIHEWFARFVHVLSLLVRVNIGAYMFILNFLLLFSLKYIS